MQKKKFVRLFITTQLILITLYIYKESALVKLAYQKQEIAQSIKKITAQKQVLTSTLCERKNPTTVKTYAQQELGMEPLRLKKIQRISL